MNVRSLGRYQIDREIGRGNMGVVYLAHDPVIERPIALKTVELPDSLPEPERETFLNRFFQEVRTAGKLTHPNVVVIHDAAIDEATDTPFIAMELVDGESLADRLARTGRAPWEKAVDWAVALARALHQAHGEGIVHRDIKPANIMITRDEVPKITDFGIAKLPNAQLTRTGVVIGTPYFMSPEQLKGETVDGRSDLFSLGVLLYTLVAGRRPFESTEIAAIASQILYKDPPPVSECVSGVPEGLDGVLARALAKAPEERYLSGEELASDLVAIRQGGAPRRALPLAERTQPSIARGASGPAHVSGTPPEPSSATAETGRSRAASSVPPARMRWRAGSLAALGLVVLALGTAAFFRGELAQQKLLFDAKRSARNGDLAASERTLEALLDTNPELESARALLGEVSGELVLPALPLERDAKHQHRFGSCTGRLILGPDGIEFSSRSHGRWRWPFERIRAFDARGPWALSLQTDEDDMLGLLDGKNYNFSLLNAPLDEEVSKRYERLFEHRRRRDAGT